MGVSRQTIQKYESGIIDNIPSDKIEIIAKTLNCSPSYIMGWDDKILSNNNNRKTDADFPPEIRSAARGMMELNEKDRKTAIDMINFLSSQGRDAKK